MILVDFSSVLITSLTANLNADVTMDEKYLRHCFIERLRTIRKKYKYAYGEMVICCDDSHYWRKDYFPFYKGKRKEYKDKSALDWALINRSIDVFREELEANFPYKVIRVSGAEGDDVVAALAKKYHTTEKILIVSSDGDYVQLQKYHNVEQYSPKMSKFIKAENPEMILKEKIIRGDTGDGIPNILSDDNVFMVSEKRQKPVYSTKIVGWLKEAPEEFCSTDAMKRNWKRNQTLIDFDFIPQEIINRIEEANEQYVVKGNSNTIFNYMMQKAPSFIGLTQDFLA